MPILRREIYTFVDNWNHHKIRTQTSRTHPLSGQPWLLYHYPKESPDQAIQPDPALLDDLLQDVAHHGKTSAIPSQS